MNNNTIHSNEKLKDNLVFILYFVKVLNFYGIFYTGNYMEAS